MLRIKRILWPTDFSRCATQALSHAVHLAKKHGAELHVMHATVLMQDDSYRLPNHEEIHRQLKDLASRHLSSTIRTLQTDDLVIKQANVRGISTAPAILAYAKENDIDLIVMGTHGRRGLGHLFLGSVAEEVVRLSVAPVLTIREREEPKPVTMMKQILVPLDFSNFSQRALQYAREIAGFYNARLQLLHVIQDFIPPTFYLAAAASLSRVTPELKLKIKEAMEKLFEETAGPAVTAEYHVIEGYAAHDIVDFAQENNSDLIVIATHGRTGIEHMLMGSVTEKVVRRAPCPVFTVRAFGKTLVH
ncbi:MAG: universal stress protein [candidate division KSB1 bacterium]|nr:universal stress protein [candidate division KSB1 bacterium]MDZ7368327.1 universal stress protein [candidate division KSB1 bacterium]MDZ7403047.1 universal stress protein [candidate division KSB1 bacterium]